MPVVYVHGIGNRWNDDFRGRARQRNALFREYLLPVLGCADPLLEPIPSPLWGDVAGADLAWEGASLTGKLAQALGPDPTGELLTELAAGESLNEPDRVLCKIARRSLPDAVDLLFSVNGAEDDAAAERAATAARHLVAHLAAVEAAMPGVDEVVRHPWLAGVHNDYAFVDLLWEKSTAGLGVDGVQVLGPADAALDWLRRGARLLRTAVVGKPTTALAQGMRAVLARRGAMLLGDVLVYFGQRGRGDRTEATIADVVSSALLQGAEIAAGTGNPLVVVAHSMGGNIVYDLLTSSHGGLRIDVLVTVGTQVGLFEELKLFHASDPTIPRPGARRVARPGNVSHWINVVDQADVLAFHTEPVFDGVVDFRYPSAAAWAHGAYLQQPHFHHRLAERIRAVPA